VKLIREMTTGELTWVQPHVLERAFEIRSGKDVLATLRWKSCFGSLADAEAADGHWTFKRTGFFSPRVTIRAHESDSNLAVFTPNWKAEGALEFSAGQTFRWVGKGFWRSRWAFTKPSGDHVLDFEPQSSLLKKSAMVKVSPEGRDLAELSLLILAGWYLMILTSEDDEASTAVICATT
jgi:hypothetical protein